MKKGKFIVIEGCEGTGKTTQIAFLKERYPDALFTREPGGTEYAEKGPRHLVLTSPYSRDLNGYEQMTQVFSGRSHHVRTVIEPALREGRDVFCDRFDASSFAYQIFGMETKLFGLFESLKLSIDPLIFPDKYIILDVSPEVGMARAADRENKKKGTSNHFDERGHEFHARVRAGYLRFIELNQSRCKLIDATGSKEEVWDSLQKFLKEVLN
jgi:dTMP kinase